MHDGLGDNTFGTFLMNVHVLMPGKKVAVTMNESGLFYISPHYTHIKTDQHSQEARSAYSAG